MEYTRPEPGFPAQPSGPGSDDENLAGSYYRRLLQWVSDYDQSLGEDHEVGMRCVASGQSMVFHLSGIGYCNPGMLRFVGTTDLGEPVELIQHLSQVNLVLVKMHRLYPGRPKATAGLGACL